MIRDIAAATGISAREILLWNRSRLIRRVMHDGIRADVEFNLELVDECRRDSVDCRMLLQYLRDDSLRKLEQHSMPISAVIGNGYLCRESDRIHRGFEHRIRNLNYVHELVARTFHRVRIERQRAVLGHKPGDLRHLKRLLLMARQLLASSPKSTRWSRAQSSMAWRARRNAARALIRLPIDLTWLITQPLSLGSRRIPVCKAGIALERWVNPLARETEYVQISQLAALGSIYIDVGANIGFTVLAALRNPKSRVRHIVAFEPNPVTFQFLREHLAPYSDSGVAIDLRMAAVGSAAGIGHLAGFDDRAHLTTNNSGCRVDVTTLDSTGIPDGEIGLLKLDLEGGEYDALLGARELLKRCKCVQFEVHCVPGSSVFSGHPQLFALLQQAGFETFQVQNKGLAPVTPDLLAARSHFNLLATRCRADCERVLGFGNRR